MASRRGEPRVAIDNWQGGVCSYSSGGEKRECDHCAPGALSPIEYDRVRKDEAEKLECRVSILDSRVQAKRLLMRPGASDNLQGEAVIFTDIEPWPEPVNGAEVLDEISKTFLSYVIQPQQNADTVTLWSAGTRTVIRSFRFRRACRSPLLKASAGKQHCAI